MKLLAIEKEIIKQTVSDNYQELLQEESLAVWQLYKKGIFREIYFTERKNAVAMLECEDVCEAGKILAELPLVKAGLIEFEIMELNAYTGFERLFKDNF